MIREVSNGTEKLLRWVHSSIMPLMNCNASLSLQCILPMSIFFPLGLKNGKLAQMSDVKSVMFHDLLLSASGISSFFSGAFSVGTFVLSAVMFEVPIFLCLVVSLDSLVCVSVSDSRVFSFLSSAEV